MQLDKFKGTLIDFNQLEHVLDDVRVERVGGDAGALIRPRAGRLIGGRASRHRHGCHRCRGSRHDCRHSRAGALRWASPPAA